MRCNTGCNPRYLADAHLIAEQAELLMVTGTLKKNNFTYRTAIPKQFKLGTGHVTFWFDKLVYLKKRLCEVKKEVARRNFKVMDRDIELELFPQKFLNDWSPSLEDTQILRTRIVEKLLAKPIGFWKYCSKNIANCDEFAKFLYNSELYFV